MDHRSNPRSFGLTLVALVWAAFLVLIGSPGVLLFTAPLFLLAAPLALGRYVGEELVERLSHSWAEKKPKAARAIGSKRISAVISATGGQILASAVAGRGPPRLTV